VASVVLIAAAALIALPHALPLHRATPLAAATAWLTALALRALAAVGVGLLFLLYVPRTGPFQTIAHVCLQVQLPRAHLGLHVHPFAHAAAALPLLVLGASVLWHACRTARAAAAVRSLLAARIAGPGPLGSTIVEADDVLVAATMLGRKRVIVSRGALEALDSDELDASVCHELAHLRRRHRAFLLLGSLFGSIACTLPGTRTTKRELAFSIERDADEYAVRETRDPIALASAICRVAGSARGGALLALGGADRASRRLDFLLEGAQQRSTKWLEVAARALTLVLALGALSLAGTLAGFASAAAGERAGAHAGHQC
jgi:Peptidase family M48